MWNHVSFITSVHKGNGKWQCDHFSMVKKTWEDDWRGGFQDFINFLWVTYGLQAWEDRKLTTWLSKTIFMRKIETLEC